MLNLAKLSTLHFWFQIRPLPMSKVFTLLFLVFFLLLIIGKVGLRMYAAKMKKQLTKADKKLYDLVQSLLLTMGLLGIAWTFFAYEGIPILSGRFWLVLWVAGVGVWAYAIFRYYTNEYTGYKEKIAERERLERYLPKKSGT